MHNNDSVFSVKEAALLKPEWHFYMSVYSKITSLLCTACKDNLHNQIIEKMYSFSRLFHSSLGVTCSAARWHCHCGYLFVFAVIIKMTPWMVTVSYMRWWKLSSRLKFIHPIIHFLLCTIRLARLMLVSELHAVWRVHFVYTRMMKCLSELSRLIKAAIRFIPKRHKGGASDLSLCPRSFQQPPIQWAPNMAWWATTVHGSTFPSPSPRLQRWCHLI